MTTTHKKRRIDWKIVIGLLLSIIFIYLAFRKVNFRQMGEAFTSARYIYLLPLLAILFFSHYLRAVRWKFLLNPIEKVKIVPLFNALMIGYMANTFLPAHLGEFVRAYMVSRKKTIPSSTVFGTIVTERIIDVFSLLLIMVSLLFLFPLPDWVKKSGLVSFVIIFTFFIFLILLKKNIELSNKFFNAILHPFPDHFSQRALRLLQNFLDGFVLLKHWSHYIIVLFLSLAIWACYAATFQFMFYAFDFINIYNLPAGAAIVLLVITTISIVVPSSPGYVGTYHYLCQLSLGLFQVPPSPALTFAILMHGMSFFPVLIVGLIILFAQGMSLKQMREKSSPSSQ